MQRSIIIAAAGGCTLLYAMRRSRAIMHTVEIELMLIEKHLPHVESSFRYLNRPPGPHFSNLIATYLFAMLLLMMLFGLMFSLGLFVGPPVLLLLLSIGAKYLRPFFSRRSHREVNVF